MSWTFSPTEEEQKKLEAWTKEHRPLCKIKGDGVTGGKYSYLFTPTSIGTAVRVRCACGVELDATDYGSW